MTTLTNILGTDNPKDSRTVINTNFSNLNTGKQETLVSGTNIKTINGNTLLGTGDLTVGNGFATTATAGTTTTLTVASPMNQDFTGTLTQTVVMPVTSTLQLGHEFWITNLSTGAVTVQSSGLNTILVVAPGTSALFTCILTSGTTASSWRTVYYSDIVASGKKVNFSNSLTLAGTDSTTMTFPSTSATIARTDAANTFTGIQTFSTPIASTSVATMTATVGGGVPTPPNNTTTFLRGDGTFAVPSAGDMVLASVQTNSGLKTFLDATLGLRNVANTFTSLFTNTNTAARTYTLQDSSDTLVGRATTDTLTNKRVTKRTLTVTQSATPAMNTDNGDIFQITGLAQAITSMTTSLTGTPVDGDMIMIQITDNGTARAITWGTSFVSTTVALPTTTVISTMLRVVLQWSSGTSKWNCVGVS